MYIFSVWLSFSLCVCEVMSLSCGIDDSPVPEVREGISRLESYPWLGVLYFPYSEYKFTTAVVLVTRQVVLAAATEIDKLPKNTFRAEARVTIGHNCSGPAIGVRDYAYHPDYSSGTFSTLAIIQLETDHLKKALRPICPPPTHFKDQKFYAMVLSDNCKQSQLRIYEMKYVSPAQCYSFYRRTGLDVTTLWPSFTTCARSISGDECIWRSGTILVVKVGKRWRLLGFGVYGPGCQAPARFLDYGMHHDWVRRSIARIGRPAVTTLDDNHIVLRKTSGNVQRFGPCDTEEMDLKIYAESNLIKAYHKVVTMKHNLTLLANIEYSCIVIRAENYKEFGKIVSYDKPKIKLRRWCTNRLALCVGDTLLDIELILEITFKHVIQLVITAYGKEVEFLDPIKSLRVLNKVDEYAVIESYEETRKKYEVKLYTPAYGNGPFYYY